MRGLSGKSDTGTIAGRIVHEAGATRRNSNTPHGKFTKAVVDNLDRSSFDPAETGYLLTFLPAPIQRTFLNLIVKYVAALAARAESGLWTGEDERMLCLDAKQIYSAVAFLDE